MPSIRISPEQEAELLKMGATVTSRVNQSALETATIRTVRIPSSSSSTSPTTPTPSNPRPTKTSRRYRPGTTPTPSPSAGTSKYRNKKVVLDGITFDSRGEADRWAELVEMQRIGQIHFLQRQVNIPAVVNGKLIFRYRADFTFVRGGKRVVEDYKSSFTRTLPDYRIKKKLLSALGTEIVEIVREKKRGDKRRGAAAGDG